MVAQSEVPQAIGDVLDSVVRHLFEVSLELHAVLRTGQCDWTNERIIGMTCRLDEVIGDIRRIALADRLEAAGPRPGDAPAPRRS
ncbi:hypothetical protein [Actinomadura rugatobispora]|uniref:Uncharacterized protein n=1 Tax=Actinomadura rugatobispora TaxID=1994 RepID=A0ABW1A0U1_9ACTN|nr:hypothetical protein GCM10010200_106260 [Actinomadura rugatobispora]